MLKGIIAGLILLLAVGSVDARADETKRLALAYAMIEISGVVKEMMDSSEIIAEAIFDAYKREDQSMEEATLLLALRQAFKDEIRASEEELKWGVAETYSRYFTEYELQVMLDFYQSPVGKQLIRVQPLLSAELGQFGQQWGETLGLRAIQRVVGALPQQ